MRTSPAIWRVLLLGLALTGSFTGSGQTSFSPVRSAQAQVAPLAPEPGAEDGDEAKGGDVRAFNKLRKRVSATEARTPSSALAQYRAFIAARPQLDPAAGVLAAHAIAQVQFQQMEDLNAARMTYDAAISKYPDEPSTTGLLIEKARLLLAQEKNDEAASLLQKRWLLIEKIESQKASPTYAGPLLYQLAVALTRQGHKPQVVSLLQNALTTLPALLDDGQQGRVDSRLPGQSVSEAGWMYNLLADLLVEEGHKEEALSWAKARWMTCNFEDADMGRAARLLAKTWKGVEPDGKGMVSFVAQQKGQTTSVSQPGTMSAKSYDNIAPPTFDTKVLEEHLASLSDSKGKTYPGQSASKIDLYILLGRYNEAMSEACTYLLVRPSAKARVQQVARVFKAADSTLDRANAFTSYFLTGTGSNPLTDFFKQYSKRAQGTPSLLASSDNLIEDVSAKAGQRKLGSPFAAPVPVAAISVPLLAIQLSQPGTGQTTSVDELEKAGLLSPEDALYALSHGSVDSELLTENQNVKAQLAGIVVRHSNELGQVPGLRDPRVRLSMGDYYRDQKDSPHAVEVYQGLVDQGRRVGVAPTQEENGLGEKSPHRAWYYLVSLERLGGIYRDQKDNTRFEALWMQERQSAVLGSEAFNTATLILARQYAATGQNDKAKAAYKQAVAGSGWTAIMAVWDQANALSDKKQYAEALQLLTPALDVMGEQFAQDSHDEAGRNPRLARMGLLTLAAFCRYKTGDFKDAHRLSQQALAIYQTADVTANLGIEEQANKARDILRRTSSSATRK